MKHTKTLGNITYGYEAATPEEVVALIKELEHFYSMDRPPKDQLKTENNQ